MTNHDIKETTSCSRKSRTLSREVGGTFELDVAVLLRKDRFVYTFWRVGMQITSLFHVAIKTARPAATKDFYEKIFGMTEAPRPPFEFPGFWMQLATPYGGAIFHVYAGHAAEGKDGTVPAGSGAIDHIALSAHGFVEIRKRCNANRIPYRERTVPNLPLCQLFVYDPNGVQFELNFNTGSESLPKGAIDPNNFPKAGIDWFNPEDYKHLKGFDAAQQTGALPNPMK